MHDYSVLITSVCHVKIQVSGVNKNNKGEINIYNHWLSKLSRFFKSPSKFVQFCTSIHYKNFCPLSPPK